MSSDEIDRMERDAADRRQEVDRGVRARQIYEDSLFKGAVEAVKDRIWDDFKQSPVDGKNGDELRRIARLKLDCLDHMLRDLRRHMETGTMASNQLPFIERTLKTLRRKRK
jgi:hypothetical protein